MSTMDVQYDEGVDSVQLVDGTLVKRGESATVSEEIGKQLCQQGWYEVGTKKRDTVPVPKPSKPEDKPSVDNTNAAETPKENN